MNKKIRVGIIVLLLVGIVAAASLYLQGQNIAVLNPKGPIAEKERALMFFALGLSLIVVIPVFSMATFFAWKYRETNDKAQYKPDWDRNIIAESIWWGIPTLLILILSIVAWNSSHSLDPFRPLNSTTPPVSIQVVALDWKWLFIYPQQNIATVNFVQFPKQTPVNFQITSDTVMNSFWIPQLGGQIYAMPGMSTQLHLLAYGNGSYYGSSANISGVGFAGMHFTAKSTSVKAFNSWVSHVQSSRHTLDAQTYNQLSSPSVDNQAAYYVVGNANLYNNVLMKYMSPTAQMPQSNMLSPDQMASTGM